MKNSQEFWKDDTEFPERYQVSSLGRVKSKGYVVIKSNGIKCTRQPKILAQVWHSTKMWRVRLCVNGQKFSRSVHRMVAKAFLGEPEVGLQVNHKDGDRSNNKVGNLEWMTQQENMEHAVETGLINNPFGEKSRNFKGVILVLDDNNIVVDRLVGNKDITEKGYCYKQVSAVLRGKQKTHKGFKFKREVSNEH